VTRIILDDMDLMLGGSKMHIETVWNTTIGGSEVLASRLQPSHPTDSPNGIASSLLEIGTHW